MMDIYRKKLERFQPVGVLSGEGQESREDDTRFIRYLSDRVDYDRTIDRDEHIHPLDRRTSPRSIGYRYDTWKQ